MLRLLAFSLKLGELEVSRKDFGVNPQRQHCRADLLSKQLPRVATVTGKPGNLEKSEKQKMIGEVRH